MVVRLNVASHLDGGVLAWAPLPTGSTSAGNVGWTNEKAVIFSTCQQPHQQIDFDTSDHCRENGSTYVNDFQGEETEEPIDETSLFEDPNACFSFLPLFFRHSHCP